MTTGDRRLSVGPVVALAIELGVPDHLIKTFLPSSPALRDCTELARSTLAPFDPPRRRRA